jgi:hypothetical protein
MAKNKSIELLRNIFPEIQFSIRTKIREEIRHTFDSESTHMEKSEELYFLLRYLEKELGKAKKKLSRAIKLHKKGEVTIEEVQDHEFNVFELQNQIEDIRGRLKWCD